MVTCPGHQTGCGESEFKVLKTGAGVRCAGLFQAKTLHAPSCPRSHGTLLPHLAFFQYVKVLRVFQNKPWN